MKTAIQCDFDGTVVEEEISVLLLEEFADGNWKEIDDAYYDGKITIKDCTKRIFSMIKADEKTLADFVLRSDRIKVRGGFVDLCNYCKHKGYYFTIVSNGLRFYIEAIINDLGISNVDIFAAQNHFNPGGMEVEFIGPDGNDSETDFKEAFTNILKKQGYRVFCIGDSISDIYTARRADTVFAAGSLQEICQKERLEYIPFNDFHDVTNSLKRLD